MKGDPRWRGKYSRKHGSKGCRRLRTSNPYWARSGRDRSGRVSYWNSCRSSDRAYYEVIVFSPAMRFLLSLRLPVYGPFQIFPHEISSQEIGVLVCELVFSWIELPCYVALILFELLSIAVNLTRKPVLSPPPWFSHDASVLIPWVP